MILCTYELVVWISEIVDVEKVFPPQMGTIFYIENIYV